MKPSDGCVFIAYDSQDAEDAQALAATFEQRGVAVWLPGRDGDPAAAAQAAAGRCAAFALVLSGRPVDLSALGELTRIADAAGRPIYPVRTSDAATVPDFPALARARGWVDATGAQRDENLARFAAELQAIAPARSSAPAAPSWPSPSAAQPQSTGGWPQAAAPHVLNVGAPAYGAPAYGAPPQPSFGGGDREERMRAFVGPNADYYLRKWGDMDRGGSKASWNWAAFLLNVYWLAYRKMWLQTAIFFVVLVALVALIVMSGVPILFSQVLLLGLAVGLGIGGNALYRMHVEKALADPAFADPETLRRRGGGSMGAAWGLAAVWFLLVGGVVFLIVQEELGLFDSPSPTYSYNPPSTMDMNSMGGTAPMGTTPMGNTSMMAGPGVTRIWLQGRWGVPGTGCASWLSFLSSGSFIDNENQSGTWSLDEVSQTLTLSLNGTTGIADVQRVGERFVQNATSGRVEWERC